MKIDDALMEHLKNLARIELGADETAALERDLNDILGYFERLSELDTEGIEPLTRPIAVTDAFRADEPTASLPLERVAALAQAMEDGMIRVPRTVEDGN